MTGTKHMYMYLKVYDSGINKNAYFPLGIVVLSAGNYTQTVMGDFSFVYDGTSMISMVNGSDKVNGEIYYKVLFEEEE